MTKKHIPERTCIGCREKRAKEDLLRFVFSPPNSIAYDPKKQLPGRGCYICPDTNCLRLVLKKRGLNRAYRTNVPQECYTQLEKIFMQILDHEK